MADRISTITEAASQPHEGADALPYERAYFERGFIAAYAWAATKLPSTQISDAVIDRAWDHRDEGMSGDDILPVTAQRSIRQAVATPPERISLIMGSAGVRIWTGDESLRRKYPDDVVHEYVPAFAPTCAEVDALAAKLADADGLDWSEDCGFEQGRDDCDSSTCVAAFYEDHNPDIARGQYRRYARIALRALGITVPADTSQLSLFDNTAEADHG